VNEYLKGEVFVCRCWISINVGTYLNSKGLVQVLLSREWRQEYV